MALYRFFFAPVLLAMAVLAGPAERAQPPPDPPAVRATDPAPPTPAAKDRARPVRSARAVPRPTR